jgi:hypothetical protein
VQAFFASLAANLDVQSLEPKQFFASGDAVVVLGAWTARAKTNQRAFHERVGDGMVTPRRQGNFVSIVRRHLRHRNRLRRPNLSHGAARSLAA